MISNQWHDFAIGLSQDDVTQEIILIYVWKQLHGFWVKNYCTDETYKSPCSHDATEKFKRTNIC